MNLTTFDWVIIFSYLCLSLAIGIWASKKAGKDTESFFLAGRNMPWWFLLVFMGSWQSACILVFSAGSCWQPLFFYYPSRIWIYCVIYYPAAVKEGILFSMIGIADSAILLHVCLSVWTYFPALNGQIA